MPTAMPESDPYADRDVTVDDERRAEIEAVARAIDQCRLQTVVWHEWTKQLAEAAIAALDRVRDARHDDEAATPLGTVCEHCERRTMEPLTDDETGGQFCGSCAVQLVAARPPQGEDHDTGENHGH